MPWTHKPRDMNLASRLTQFLSQKQIHLIQLIADEASRLGLTLYAVGGLPRDLLLRRFTRDLDLVVEGEAIPLARALSRLHGGRVNVHPAFHTATWTLPPALDFGHSTLDLISARSETYQHPAALPTVSLGTLADDLQRRDFAINAMAICLNGDRFGELVDPLGGQADLEAKVVRALHPRSFEDDPTRIFRAVRYAGRLGFAIAPETKALIPAAVQHVDALSPERLRHELDLIFEEEDSVPMLNMLWDLNVLQSVLPPLPSDPFCRARFEKSRSHFFIQPRALSPEISQRRDWRWMTWFLACSSEEISAFDQRLAFPADLRKKCLATAALHKELDLLQGSRPSGAVIRFDAAGEDAVMVNYICASLGDSRGLLEKYLTNWKLMKPKTTSQTLLSRGIPPGPRFGEILQLLRAAWLDGEVKSEDEEERLLMELIKK